MTRPNAALAYRVLDHIDAHPEQWDQGDWWRRTGCGTRGCFAGWALALSGVEMPDHPFASDLVTVDGERFLLRAAAYGLLGLDPDGAYGFDENDNFVELFDGDNTRERLGLIVEQLFGPRPTEGGEAT